MSISFQIVNFLKSRCLDYQLAHERNHDQIWKRVTIKYRKEFFKYQWVQ